MGFEDVKVNTDLLQARVVGKCVTTEVLTI